jgi:hypothetical protein
MELYEAFFICILEYFYLSRTANWTFEYWNRHKLYCLLVHTDNLWIGFVFTKIGLEINSASEALHDFLIYYPWLNIDRCMYKWRYWSCWEKSNYFNYNILNILLAIYFWLCDIPVLAWAWENNYVIKLDSARCRLHAEPGLYKYLCNHTLTTYVTLWI